MPTIDLTKIDPSKVKVEAVPEQPPKGGGGIALADVNPADVKIESVPNPRRKLSFVESLGSGLSQGLTFGFADEIAGAARAGIGKLQGEGNYSDLYKKYRDEQRAHMDAAKVDNKGAYVGGEIAGTIGTSFVPGAAALSPVKGASVAANVGRAAAGGALTSAGLSNADPTASYKDLKQFGKDVGAGAALGGGLELGFSWLGKGINALKPGNLKSSAEEYAVKAAGAMTKETRDLRNRGLLNSTGRELLDKKIVTAFSTLDDVAERSKNIMNAEGPKIGEIVKNADDVVKTAKDLISKGQFLGELRPKAKQALLESIDEDYLFSMRKIGENIDEQLIKPNKGFPNMKGEVAKLEALRDAYKGLDSVSMKTGHQLKQKEFELIKNKLSSDTVPAAFQKDVYNIIKDELERSVSNVANLETELLGGAANLGAKDVASNFRNANREFAVAKNVNTMANKRLDQAKGVNQTIGLSDVVLGGAGFAGGLGGSGDISEGAKWGLILGALNKGRRTYGASLQAVGADKLAKILARSPDKLGQFGEAIYNAGSKGPLALMATHLALSKNPDYQNILQNFEPEARGLRLPNQSKGGLKLPQGRNN